MASISNDDPNKKNEEITPEERLFQVISSGKGSLFDDSKEAGVENDDMFETDFLARFQKNVDRWRARLIQDMGEVGASVCGLLRRFGGSSNSSWHRISHAIQLKVINRGLVAVIAALFIYLTMDFLFISPAKSFGLGMLEAGASHSALNYQMPIPEQLSYYLDRMRLRNVFQLPEPPVPEVVTETSNVPAQPQPPKTLAAPTNYKLVGVSWDENEYVAMIEYDPDKGASFVREGDQLENGVKVKKIEEFTVYLSNGNQEWKLE